MIKFVIVDDEKEEINHIEKLLEEVVKVKYKTVNFTKVNNELKEEIQNLGEHKIYILDIELKSKVSGINIAKIVREIDWESEIIFITNHSKMFESVHRSVYEVFDFIEKFHDFEKRFKKDIKDILNRNFDNKMFTYRANNADLSLYYRNILYIYRETNERKLVIVTDKNNYKVALSLKEILTMLDDRFVQCHKSCIINTNRVQEKNYKEGYFTLDNGKKVDMLSKKGKKELEAEV